ncbi:MAG: hypothetical protein A2987_05450 [Omnitrophica bacterium RIFCSPLOWO2_01_FULL_45_10]|nr:MAG: hypothetical protein A2987_05450 [Omnitrophica bacterium RIFCSPLOWO2_01_FULL_45_10]
MFKIGDVISYLDMCREEGCNLQRGMNYRLRPGYSVILMSLRKGAPYVDRVEENGKVLIYEGHDIPKFRNSPDPKSVDQPRYQSRTKKPTQNGHFCNAVERYRKNPLEIERVRVYEKIKSGIWVYNGLFLLDDYQQERSNGRKVFKFRLEMVDADTDIDETPDTLEHNRIIPTQVKLEVWKRDKGQCIMCESKDNLHFDHILPYSKGGTSLKKENIQLLCVRHNLEKRDKII